MSDPTSPAEEQITGSYLAVDSDLVLKRDPRGDENERPFWLILPLVASDSSFREELALACRSVGHDDWADKVLNRQLPPCGEEEALFVELATRIYDCRGIPPAPIDTDGQLDHQGLDKALKTTSGLRAFFAGL